MSNEGNLAELGPAANEKAAARSKDRAKRQQQQEDLDLVSVMSTPAGRRFVWRALAEFRLYQTSFTGNSTTFYNEGMRAAGLWLLDHVMRVCPELYLEAQREAIAAKEKLDA